MIQAKTQLGERSDPLEREADAVADGVTRALGANAEASTGHGAVAQAPPGPGSGAVTPAVRRAPAGAALPPAPPAQAGRDRPEAHVERAAAAVASGGRPLPSTERARMEPHLGRDLSTVRIHDDPSAGAAASAIHARAYTVGRHIAFGEGQYAPDEPAGRRLLAHELAHVVQQGEAETPLIQRDEGDLAPAATSMPEASAATEPPGAAPEQAVPEDETPRHRGIDYEEAARQNRLWFDLLGLGLLNPFRPYDPYRTPNAFINRVAAWQQRARQARLAELVFAAEPAQREVREGTLASLSEPVAEVDRRLGAGERIPLGQPIDRDGVLGPRTFWTMMTAAALSTDPGNRAILTRLGIPLDPLAPLAEADRPEWQGSWRAVHAYLFNRPRFVATWETTARSDLVLGTFEHLAGLSEENQGFLAGLFFPYGLPEDVAIGPEDLLAILARGYAGESLEGLASLMEVDRAYYHNVDVQRLLLTERQIWRTDMDVRMAEADASRANLLVEELGLQVPAGERAQQAYGRLQQQAAEDGGLARPAGPLTVLVTLFRLPTRPPQFWPDLAGDYVAEKVLLEESAEEATEAYLSDLERRYQERMAGTADIRAGDAEAFLELLVGETFTSAQEARVSGHTREAAGHDIEFISRPHQQQAAARANALLALAERELYLIVQLGERRESRFPLPLRQIQLSRSQAGRNGASPRAFDVIDTPHAAMHMYTPTRFSARATEDGGSEAASNAYRLEYDRRLGERGRVWEDWANFLTQHYGPFEPVLVEIREFNPEAGQLVRAGRQLFGTDRVVLRYVWTLGGSLPDLNDRLWSAQGTVNLFGWIDAVLTIGALASVVAAPLLAGAEAGASTAATQIGRAAVTAAARRSLVQALRRFIVSEAIGEGLGRATYHINDDPDVPDAVKTAWNGLMVALLIYGIGATVRQGIRSFRNRGSVRFRQELAALEAELEAESRGTRAEAGAAEAAAQAEVRQRTAARFRERMAEAGLEGAEGPGRVRSEDVRTGAAAAEPGGPRGLTVAEGARLRAALGEEAAATLATSTTEATRRRLAAVQDPEAIRALNEALTPDLLTRLLASVDAETLSRFARALGPADLAAVLRALGGTPPGVALLRAFSGHADRLSRLLAGLGERRLLALAENPGVERLFRLASRVDPAAIVDALQRMGRDRAQTLYRFRQLLEDVGAARAAEVLNTYTGAEIRARWRAREGMSPAQNVTRLAIQRGGEPTVARRGSGIPIATIEPRPASFVPDDFRTFFAIGPEASAPATVRESVGQVREASARAANHLEELIDRAARGVLTDVDLQAVPPNARATVEAFLRGAPGDANYHALYGSALQYLAEAELRALFGGSLPPGMAVRRTEVRRGRTLIPDAQVELTLQAELRYPQRNRSERVVIDWTTAGEAGKVTKYRGGRPPVTWAVEIIQPGPPSARATPSPTLPPIRPSMPTAPPETETETETETE